MRYSILLFSFVVIAVGLASNLPHGNLSPGIFGLKKSDLRNEKFYQRMVGGVIAQIDQAPWQVAIEARSYGDLFSGAIIDRNSVLTSAYAVCRLNT